MLAPVTAVLILFACFFIVDIEANFITDLFNPGLDKSPKFSGSQLYLLDPDDMGLGGAGGFVGCFGDFNSDKYTDLFVISGNGSETVVDVYLWSTLHWQFENSSASVAVPYITNIAAGDFDYDGKLDLLVSGLNITNNNTYVKIFHGDLTTLAATPISELEAASQVEVLDANNDLHLDLFGEMFVLNITTTVNCTYDNSTNGNNTSGNSTFGNSTSGNSTSPNCTYTNTTTTLRQRVFWLNTGDGHFDVQLDTYQAPLREPHSNAFVDLNGDCLADRFVTSVDANGNPQYEIWINEKKNGYTLHSTMPLPLGAGQVTFSDFDRDGNLDFLIPVCYPQPSCSQENSIYIVFNQQKGLCSLLKKSSTCRSSTELCSADPNFKLGQLNASATDPLITIIPTSVLNATGTFYFNNELGRPLMLRVGDYNLDGYPDLLIPLTSNGTSHMELWSNAAGEGSRTFVRVEGGAGDLTGISNAYAGAFFDLDEDGVSDMIVLADNPPRIESVYNNFDFDAFFLKALGLNGVCPEWCPGVKFPSPKPYGVNYAGGVFKFTYTDLSGRSILQTGTQLPQSSYLALNTPYILFGLGRTSNYIEQFFFGVALMQPTHFNYWTGSTIPNSQLVAVPYKPENPGGWTLELYITPSGLLFWIMVALVGSLLILSIIVCIFYRKEKKEDELKKQEQAHLFSFDAL